MTLLAPLALIGALLLILPIIVHLFKPRKMRQTPFSSLRWLKQTHQRLSRRIEWHQWLLFLLRAGCILLLFLTDNLQARWQQQDVKTFLTDLLGPVQVKVIDVGAGSGHNAWIAGARLFQFGADADRWIRVEVGCVGETRVARSVSLTGIA